MTRSAGVEGLGSAQVPSSFLVPRAFVAAASSDHGTASARSSGNFDGQVQAFPSRGSGPSEGRPVHRSGFLSRSVREAGDGPIARFVTRRNRWVWSPLRAALRELARNP